MKHSGPEGVIGDLDGRADQRPLNETEVEQAIKNLLPAHYFDPIISHYPIGESTSNIWHEAIGKAVLKQKTLFW